MVGAPGNGEVGAPGDHQASHGVSVGSGFETSDQVPYSGVGLAAEGEGSGVQSLPLRKASGGRHNIVSAGLCYGIDAPARGDRKSLGDWIPSNDAHACHLVDHGAELAEHAKTRHG